MNPTERRWIRSLMRLLEGSERAAMLERLPIDDRGFGYDAFGCERESALAAYAALRLLHRYYFRVESSGVSNVPSSGRAILVANHSGLLPFDGAMIGVDLMMKLARPRLVRSMVDHDAFGWPYLSKLFLRSGQVPGTKRNFEELLEQDQLVLVFPEGARGSCKLWSERYRLRRFNVGFAEIALRQRAPIIPVAVVGAEEQAPVIFGSERLGRRLGLPFIPVTPTFPLLGPLGLLPYPVRYSITYGEPILLHELDDAPAPDEVPEPIAIERIVARVRDTVQALVDDGLRERGAQPRSDRVTRSPAPPPLEPLRATRSFSEQRPMPVMIESDDGEAASGASAAPEAAPPPAPPPDDEAPKKKKPSARVPTVGWSEPPSPRPGEERAS